MTITNNILIWDTKKDAEQFKKFVKEIWEEIWKKAVIVREIDLNRKIIYADEVEDVIKQKSGFEELK